MDKAFKHQTLGEFYLETDAEDIFCWVGTTYSAMYKEEVPINILSTSDFEIGKTKWDLIEKVVKDLDKYINVAISFAKKKFLEDPDLYKLNKEELEEITICNVENFPLDLPVLNFYDDDNEWMLIFAEGRLQICDPFGLAIAFNQFEPVRIEDLSESEETE